MMIREYPAKVAEEYWNNVPEPGETIWYGDEEHIVLNSSICNNSKLILKTHPKKEGEKPCENGITEIMNLLFEEYKTEKLKIHCKICMCPIDLWNPLKTYKSDKSCWLVEDLLGILHKHEKEFIKVEDLIKEIKREVKQYGDIPDVDDTAEELLFIAKDLDRINEEEKGKFFVY